MLFDLVHDLVPGGPGSGTNTAPSALGRETTTTAGHEIEIRAFGAEIEIGAIP